MEINRRRLLAGALATALPIPALHAAGGAAARGLPELFAATRKEVGGYAAAIFDAAGRDHARVMLPARGHDISVCPVTRRCVAFARRPGNFAVVFSHQHTFATEWFTTPAGRHFYGHGVFSPDGKLLYTTENDFEAGEGRIGVYDASGAFNRIGEFPSCGTGPHDLALMPDGRTLVIANGGIETHPEVGAGRTPLNLATMQPSIAYVDRETGDLIERHQLGASDRQMSLRHLDIGADGKVVIGGQFKGDQAAPSTPLIATHKRGEDIRPVPVPLPLEKTLRGYISSVAVDSLGEFAALTSSRGGKVLFLDLAGNRLVGVRDVQDVSGVAPSGERSFLVTSGEGRILAAIGADDGGSGASTPYQWDNHAVRI